VAFFDMDKTLLAVNSGSLWVRREAALGHLSKRQALRAMLWLARYHLGFAAAEEMVERAVAEVAGSSSAALAARTRDFYDEQVSRTYRPGGLDAVARHRAAGDRLVLLTSSTAYLSELVGAALGLDALCCNRLEVGADGQHTGKIVGRACFGAGKVGYAQAEVTRAGAQWADCVFYTDSYSDLPVLERVGVPVAVNPDPRLRRHAERAGWRVEDWGATGVTTAPATALQGRPARAPGP
jgi:HAD superfamily hydrolase (TIGR01490 family)